MPASLNPFDSSIYPALVVTLLVCGSLGTVAACMAARSIARRRQPSEILLLSIPALIAFIVGAHTANAISAHHFLHADDAEKVGYASAAVAAGWIAADHATGCHTPISESSKPDDLSACLTALRIVTKGEMVPFAMAGDTLRLRTGTWPLATVIEAPRPDAH